jgi:MSHA pilin protein MshD
MLNHQIKSNKQNQLFAYLQYGVTLVELIVFIVIISVAIVGILKVLEVTNKASVDPLINKQALAIAESLLNEIVQQPFTYCDPDDANAATATSTTGCAGTSQDNGGGTLGPTPNTESRYSNTNPFDNVADYNGFTMPSANCAGICNPGGNGTGTVIADSPSGYTATVAITRIGGNALFPGIPLNAALKITITVTGPANTTVSLSGYKVRYAPNI